MNSFFFSTIKFQTLNPKPQTLDPILLQERCHKISHFLRIVADESFGADEVGKNGKRFLLIGRNRAGLLS